MRALLFIILLSPLFSFPQDFSNYKSLECKGIIPEEITTRTSVKLGNSIINEMVEEDKESKKSKKKKSKPLNDSQIDFLVQSNYMVDQILTSGKVLFGDTVTTYVNSIVDKLLANDLELRGKIKVFTIKSNVSNAFCTHQGLIFVTLGLISQMENEAQLAFVLSHEITHFKNKHLINSVLKKEEIFNKDFKGQANQEDRNIVILSNYSKKLELEADSNAYFMIQKAKYNPKDVKRIFDVLKYAHLPFDEVSYDYSFLESENLKIPAYLKIPTIIEISEEDEDSEDDKYSTHPNIGKRVSFFEEIDNKNNSNQTYFDIDNVAFMHIRKICRYEAIIINLKNFQFSKAIYNSLILSEKDKSNLFLKKCIGNALYGLSKFKGINQKENRSIINEGEISATYYFFDEIKGRELTLISLKYLCELYNATKDSHVKKLIKNLAKDCDRNNLIKPFEIAYSDFENDTISVKKDKYSKIKQKELSNEKEVDSFLYKIKNSFITDLAQFDELKKEFNQQKDTISSTRENVLWDNYLSDSNSIDNAIFIEPEAIYTQQKRGINLIFSSSENQKFEFIDQLSSISSMQNFNLSILSKKKIQSTDIKKLNELNALSDWLVGRSLLNSYKLNWDYISMESESISNICSMYNTQYIGITGIETTKDSRSFGGENYTLGLFIPWLVPVVIGVAVTPQHNSYYYTFIFDSKSGQCVVNKVYEVGIKANKENINSFMYDFIKTLKKKK